MVSANMEYARKSCHDLPIMSLIRETYKKKEGYSVKQYIPQKIFFVSVKYTIFRERHSFEQLLIFTTPLRIRLQATIIPTTVSVHPPSKSNNNTNSRSLSPSLPLPLPGPTTPSLLPPK